jgi:uncharacterized membrane protein (GlpM family)
MKEQLLTLAIVVIVLGVLLGTVVVLLISWQRRKQVVSSLPSLPQLVGLIATVEVPFDRTDRGKVRVNAKGAIIDVVAYTDEASGFQAGDRVLITEARGDRVWVVSEQTLRQL